jgi:hypothetical protein
VQLAPLAQAVQAAEQVLLDLRVQLALQDLRELPVLQDKLDQEEVQDLQVR